MKFVAVTFLLWGIVAARAEDKLPTGDKSPEGAAGDLIRAYIAKDEKFFHARRATQSCEGLSDPGIAWKAFLKHSSVRSKKPKQKASGAKNDWPVRMVRIEIIVPSRQMKEESELRSFGLRMNYGAIESRVFEVTTETKDGRQFRSRVQALHLGKLGDGGINKMLPTGTWKAQLIVPTSMAAQ